jgi:hypothetical protein
MSWDAIGAIAELVGATGVIVTLLYVGREIRLTGKAQRAATQHDVLAEFRALMGRLIEDPALCDAFQKFSHDEEIPSEHRYRFALFIGNQFRVYEELYLAHLDGSVSDEFWRAREANLRSMFLDHPFTHRWWRNAGSSYSQPFVELIERLVTD